MLSLTTNNMIQDLKSISSGKKTTHFQSSLLSKIAPLLEKVNLDDLRNTSIVEANDYVITISLVHKDDMDTIITLNISRDHASLWYTSCDLYVSDDFDMDFFYEIYEKCLYGNYETNDVYYKKKLIYSVTIINESDITCTLPYSFFYKIYIRYFKMSLTYKTIKFKSFI